MAKVFATYQEMQQAVDVMATMISTDHKRRLAFYREKATNHSVRTIRTAIIDLTTDEVTPLQASFKMDGPTNAPLTPMAKWKGIRHAFSRFFFTRIARKPELLLLANNRDLDLLVTELPELAYLLEFNKYLKRACFTNIAAEDMESKDGWPTYFTWSSAHRHQHSVRQILVGRTLKWRGNGISSSLPHVNVEVNISKYGITAKDIGKIQYLSFALTYPVSDWPKIDDLLQDPQVEPLVDLWLCPRITIEPKHAG